MSAESGIVDTAYWREHAKHNIVTTEQALTFLDDIDTCRRTIDRLARSSSQEQRLKLDQIADSLDEALVWLDSRGALRYGSDAHTLSLHLRGIKELAGDPDERLFAPEASP